ncbi:hypothetical protein D3C75_1063200 [compost metagenome]
MARQVARHLATGIEAAGFGLHMLIQAPVEFTLQQQIHRRGQLLNKVAEHWNMAAPVMAVGAIATAD